MSGTEALARVLETSERFIAGDGLPGWRLLTGGQLAERILADPGPLLAALAEAGVLRGEWCSRNANGGGAIYATRAEAEGDRDRWNADLQPYIGAPPSPPVVEIQSRYVTEWRPTDA